MTALITGVAGFVGHGLATALLSRGERVIGIDAITDYYDPRLKRENLRSLTNNPDFQFHEVSLADAPLDDLLKGATTVFHQAGQPGVRKSWGRDFATYSVNNVEATQTLLEAVMRADGVEKVVYASSSSIYGDAERYPTSEVTTPSPRSPYGVTKLAAEHLCSLYAANFGVPTVSLRYFTVYGPGQRPDMAFTRFLTAAHLGSDITVLGDGEQRRDFTYVADVVRANIAASEASSNPGSVYNVAGGSNVSVNEVLDTIRGFTEKKLNVVYKDSVAGDVRKTGGDTTAIRRDLGWVPSISLDEGLERQFAWAKTMAESGILRAETIS
ncbi:UNVERIFIED_ORG: nucleoside-diphosphate-sugar epimerase [Gordonia westfalica J30]